MHKQLLSKSDENHYFVPIFSSSFNFCKYILNFKMVYSQYCGLTKILRIEMLCNARNNISREYKRVVVQKWN